MTVRRRARLLVAAALIPLIPLCLSDARLSLLLPALVYIVDYLDADAIVLRVWEKGSLRSLIPPEAYRFPIREKGNLNVLVVGTSGKGKTNLLDHLVSKYFDRFAVMSFKEGDLHLGLDAEVIDVSEYGPFDRESFIDAFMLTFQPKVVGEVVSRYAGLLAGVVARSSDWNTLLEALEEAIRGERDRINRTALLSLRDKIYLILPKGSGDVPVGDRVVYDLSKLNDYQRSFFAELILRRLRNARDMALVIDEAYRVFRRTEHHASVLEILLREGRARNLAIMVATQSILDIPEPIIPQFDTIFVFSTTGEDLDMLRRMGIPQDLVLGLGNYECIDARSGSTRFHVLRFKRFRRRNSGRETAGIEPPDITFTGDGFTIGGRYRLELRRVNGLIEVELRDSKGDWSSDHHYVRRVEEIMDTPIGNKLREVFGDHADLIMERIRGVHLKTGVDYRSEIIGLLREHGIMSTSAIARAVAERLGLDLNSTKFACLTYLRRMREKGEIVSTEVRDEHNRKIVYHELPSTSESHLHKLLVEKVMSIAWKLGLKAERRRDVDLAVEDIGIEVETGKKSRKPRQRLGYREVWIVVPNEEVKERYPGSMTLRELYIRLKKMGESEAPSEIHTGGSRAARSEQRTSAPVNEELAVAALNYVKRSMAAYLDGKKNLNWIIGVIRSSGVRGQLLTRVFEELKDYGDRMRWEEALEACRRKELI